MNRGSHTVGDHPRQRAMRFNEAPIHESGKFRKRLRCLVPIGRFNEAPIHESGKFRKILLLTAKGAGLQ